MSDYIAAEIDKAIYDNADGNWDDLGDATERYPFPDLTLRDELVPVKVIEAQTGGEGQGESCYIVFQVGDQLFKKEGWYASHYGTEWDGSLYEVTPEVRSVTFYVRKG